ncbi:MAG: secretin N-terminal domain-containing protein [Verrucomicrobiaceae bacterium]
MKRTIAIFLGIAAMAGAQEPTPTPTPTATPGADAPVQPLPGTLPGTDPVVPVAPAQPGRAVRPMRGPLDPNAIAVPEGDEILRPEMTGIDAAEIYRKHTGKRVILTSQASQVQAYFVQPGPMTNAEVAKLLEITLLAEGLAIVPDQLDPDIVRIVASGPTQGTGSAPLAYLDDPLDLPLTDQLVTYRMEFNHLKPEEALRVFQSVMGQSSPSGSITAVTNASSLIIKENSSLIRQLIKLRDDIDRSVRISEEWVKVVYADVDEIAERLNEIYNERNSSNTTTRTTRQRAPLPGGTATAAAASAGGSAEEVPINIIPDSRTNRILLVGRPADIAVVTSLIQGYDVPSDGKNDFTYRLRYLRVGEFIPIAYDAIEATMSSSSTSGAGGGGLPNQNQNSRTNNQSNVNNNRTNTTGGGGASGGSRTNLEEQDIPTAPEAQIIGKTLLVADNVANAVIVNGPPHHIEIVKNLISQLDSPGQQVVISAVIGSYTLGDNLNFGFDLARIIGTDSGDQIGGRLTFGDQGAGALSSGDLDNLAGLLTANGATGAGTSLYGIFNDNFSVFVNALEANTNFKTLERPVVTTRNNRVARISSGRRIAIPASTFNSGVNGGQNTNVEYRDVTLELAVQPLINSDTQVTLEISLVRDAVQDTSRTIAAGVDVPDIATEELTTSVITESGSAIILGGLITEEDTDSTSGVPFLSRVPGLGRLFSSTKKNTQRRELIILLRPQIISNVHDYRNFEDGFEAQSPFIGEARDSFPPTGNGMLPAKGTLEDAKSGQRAEAVRETPKKETTKKASPPRRSGGGFRRFGVPE